MAKLNKLLKTLQSYSPDHAEFLQEDLINPLAKLGFKPEAYQEVDLIPETQGVHILNFSHNDNTAYSMRDLENLMRSIQDDNQPKPIYSLSFGDLTIFIVYFA